MEPVFAVLVGILYACGLYLILRRSILKLIIGLALLGHAANLLIFTSGRLVAGAVPLIDSEAVVATGRIADPLPQALILTAIVIGFGMQAFVIILMRRLSERTGKDDLHTMTSTDRLDEPIPSGEAGA